MNNEDVDNIIELVKDILSFYANSDNYITINKPSSLINLDNGTLAKFAMDKINEFNNLYDVENYNIDDEN